MAFKELLPSTKEKPKDEDQTLSELQALMNTIRASFYVQTWLAMGAVAQSLLLLLPIRRVYAVAPATLYLLFRFIQGLLITYNILPNHYLKDAILHKYTASVPGADGTFPSEDKPAANERVAILLLSAKVNHPFGLLGAPHAQTFGEHFNKMRDELSKLPQSETGFLGQSTAEVPAANGCVEILTISYWRSAAHVLKYAESPLHRDAVNWWNNHAGELSHFGIGHEVYESPSGMWENVYANFQPTLMGATTYLREGNKTVAGEVDSEWIRPLLDARKGKLTRSRGRMGWNVTVGGQPDF